jgi:hypothetical protein
MRTRTPDRSGNKLADGARTCTIRGGVASIVADADEVPGRRVEPARPPVTSALILALQAPRRDGDLEVHSHPVRRHLVVGRELVPGGAPVHARVRLTVPQHRPQRLRGAGPVRAAGHVALLQRAAAARQVPAQVPRAVARRIAPVRVPVAARRPRRHDHARLVAVEEEVLVPRGQREAGARVQAEGRRVDGGEGPRARPHGRVRHDEVRVGVVRAGHRVRAGRGAEAERGVVGAGEHVPVVRAAAPVVDAQRVADWDVAAAFAAEPAGDCRWYYHGDD